MKVSVVILVALAITVLLRKQSAALRHWVLAAAIGCAAVTPVLDRLVPSWPLPLITASAIQRIEEATQPVAGSKTRRGGFSGPVEQEVSGPVQQAASRPLRMVTASELLGPIWMAGVGISLFVIAIGLGRLARLASRSRRLTHGRWPELAEEISREYVLRRPVLLLQSDHPSLLVTWGLARSKIILPAAAAEWSEDLIRVVLCHELAHIRRGDWIVQMAGELLRSVYWFNPIVWVACRRLRLESEHACDDAVLNRGVEGSNYARHLLGLARALNQPRRPWFPALAMARPSSLQRRITAMLNDRLNRNPMSRSARVTTVMALLTVTVAVAAAQAFATFSGSVVDPLGGVMPDVRLILANAQRGAKYEVRSNRYGQFEFVGLPPGDYMFEAQLPGFATFRQTLTVAGQNVEHGITLQLGSLEETVTIRISDNEPSSTAPVQLRSPRNNPPCNGSPIGAIGGNIRVPMKVRDAAPQYPQNLRGSGTEGMVVMDGHIGLDGFIRDLQVRNQAHPDVVHAAVNAVSQWQYDSTLLNCVPVEVSITVTARFIHEP